MGRKLIDHAIGGDFHVIVESDDQGKFDVRVSYPVTKLQSPVTTFLQKITAKIPFLQSRIPMIVDGLFLQFGALPAAQELPSDTGPAAHEAAPIEPAAPQA